MLFATKIAVLLYKIANVDLGKKIKKSCEGDSMRTGHLTYQPHRLGM